MSLTETCSEIEKQQSIYRNTNVEILRLCSMFLILLSHFAFHSKFSFDERSVSLNRFFSQVVILGNVGVNIFVIISGFYLYSDSGVCLERYYRIIPLWRQMFFYSALLYVFLVGTHIISFRIIDFVKSLYPIIFEEWWFATTYILLLLFYPFINSMIITLNKKKHSLLLLILVFCWSIIPSFTGQYLKSNDLLWFIQLYLIGAYIKKHISSFKKSSLAYYFIAAWFYVAFCLFILAFDLAGIKNLFARQNVLWFVDKQKIIIFPISICLFLGTIKLKFRVDHWINTISRCTFGVYLITENHFVRPLIWNTINPVLRLKTNPLFILYSFLFCICVYLCCVLIELFRIKVIDYLYNRIFGKYETMCFDFFLRKLNTIVDGS